MSINISGLNTNATNSTSRAAAGPATGDSNSSGSLTTSELIKLIAKILSKQEENVKNKMEAAAGSGQGEGTDKMKLMEAQFAQQDLSATFTSLSGMAKADGEMKQTAARRN